MSKEEEFKNPSEYTYRGGEKIVIDGYLFREVMREIKFQMSEEIIQGFVEPIKKVNPKTYQEATAKQIKAGEFAEVTDIEVLMQMKEPSIIFTPRGKNLTMINLNLEKVHHDNVQSGNAVALEDLKAEYEKSKEPKLKKV